MVKDYLGKLLGEWSIEVNLWSTLLKVALILIMSTILGCERARNRHAAGLRTFMVVSLGAVFASIADLYFIQNLGLSFTLLSAATVIAIAIISSNTILYSSKNQLKGLTTSVSLWAMTIIAIVLGLGLYTVAIVGFLVLMIGLSLFVRLENSFKANSNHFEIHLELISRNALKDFVATMRKFGIKIDDIEINPAYHNSGLSVYTIKLTIVDKSLLKKTHSEILEALSSLEYVSHIEEL